MSEEVTSDMISSLFHVGPITIGFVGIVGFAWLCIECGQFVESRFTIGKERLFWHAWSLLWMVLLLVMLYLDRVITLTGS